MTFRQIALAAVAHVALGTAALANPSFDNTLALNDGGSGNVLEIMQPATMSGNSVSITIEGENNGGLGGEWRTPELFSGFLEPGNIEQTGNGNVARLEVFGTSNLFSALQTGSQNSVSGFISGSNNATAVMQVGVGNVAQFRQVGTGNTLAISQSSW